MINAAGHPGKIGDCLYCLPLLNYLSERDGVIFDFYTSTYCAVLKELFEKQSCINSFSICEGYEIQSLEMGVQPWYLPIPAIYEKIYQLGFKEWPDKTLHQWIAEREGIKDPLSIAYTCNPSPRNDLYYCVSMKTGLSYTDSLIDFIKRSPLPCLIIGSKEDYFGTGEDYTGLNMLDTCSLISGAQAFIGVPSSQLVLANGFDIPRICIHDNASYDMRHVITYHRNSYLVRPDSKTILNEILENKYTYG